MSSSARRPLAACAAGSIGDRPLQSAAEAHTAPVGADVLIRPVGLWPLARHGSIGDRPLHTTPVGADYISARSSNDFGGASPGRIYNAPLHPRPEIALVGADVLIRPSAFGRFAVGSMGTSTPTRRGSRSPQRPGRSGWIYIGSTPPRGAGRSYSGSGHQNRQSPR